MPGSELGINLVDLCLQLPILRGLDGEQLSRQDGHAFIDCNAIEQRNQVGHPFSGGQPEFGGIAADGVGQLGAIADQPIPHTDQH
jgi:hypothetical protein